MFNSFYNQTVGFYIHVSFVLLYIHFLKYYLEYVKGAKYMYEMNELRNK